MHLSRQEARELVCEKYLRIFACLRPCSLSLMSQIQACMLVVSQGSSFGLILRFINVWAFDVFD
jgi:hypothetical protein